MIAMLLIAGLMSAGLLGPAKVPRLQTLQGATCTGVTFWFADASTRIGSKAVRPILTVYNGQAVSQTAKITTRPDTVASGSAVVTVEPFERVRFDLSQLINGGADFAVEVECSAICAADLKMVGSVVVAAAGLPLCR